MVRYIDLTLPIEEGMPVWPGDSGPECTKVKSLEQDGYVLQTICFSNHMGTHLDAPSHVVPGGMTLDQIPPETLIGRAVLLNFADKGKKDRITRKDLQARGDVLRPGARVLLRTGWDKHYGSSFFFQDFPCLTLEAAQDLAQAGVALLGMDTPSPSPIDDPDQGIHKALLGAGIVLVEGLINLHLIRGNECDLIVLPPLFKGFSGSPCRAFAVEKNFSGTASEQARQDRGNSR
jgi:arylformamidase